MKFPVSLLYLQVGKLHMHLALRPDSKKPQDQANVPPKTHHEVPTASNLPAWASSSGFTPDTPQAPMMRPWAGSTMGTPPSILGGKLSCSGTAVRFGLVGMPV